MARHHNRSLTILQLSNPNLQVTS